MAKKLLVALLSVMIFVGLCIGTAVTSSPYDGTGWNTSAPNEEAKAGDAYQELQDLRTGVELRINKEHETLASSSAGGVHKQGSARAFFQDAEPTTQVNGDAFDSGDLGSLWFDSNASIDNQFNVLTATTPTWTPVSTEIIAVLLASNRQFAGTLTVDGTTTLTGAVTANGGVTLGAGDDLIGSSTSDITINTDKFTVAGDTGNTVVAGTLGVTGASTFTAGITCNGGVTLGAGDDLIGSSTSDITINTDKFTVAGDTGNTVIAGALNVTGSMLGAYAADDDDTTAMTTAHAYLANQDGMVTVRYNVTSAASASVIAYVDTDNNPASGGTTMGTFVFTTYPQTNDKGSFTFPVQKGKYFEVTVSNATATMIWTPFGTLIKCTDQD